MHWFLLILGGFFEMGWAIGLKLSQTMQIKFWGILMAVCSMAISVGLLYFAQKEIPIGTAYIVWAGIGAVSTMAVGIIFFGESAAFWRLFFAALILVGVIGIRMQS
ncbi:multidrug efflux SMR transporter [Bacteroidales bacterium OttesenSCG-928-K22]|nr:multidrug efflux SMR transporter [Bacteroidales bacterium OttesenSCG-928-L14]MDL2241142.1 multidrug efflux SMR transporter [Bacteroidales bacterium OttesenSCG-928-K22]